MAQPLPTTNSINLAILFRHEDKQIKLAAGETLFKEGDKGEEAYVMLSGEADIKVGDRVVELAAGGTILGEMALIDTEPRAATVTARTECTLAVIDGKRFNHLVQQTSLFAIIVMRVMVRRLRRMDAGL